MPLRESSAIICGAQAVVAAAPLVACGFGLRKTTEKESGGVWSQMQCTRDELGEIRLDCRAIPMVIY